MADRKENLKALFSNARSRVIILFTVALVLMMILVGYFKFKSSTAPSLSGANIATGPSAGMRSIPGSANQSAQYAFLQEKQNIEQAKLAAKKGGSAIPTIVRSYSFGDGVQAVGPQHGKGGLGFSALSREETSGPQLSLWVDELKKGNCSPAVTKKVIEQGAGLADLKKVCTCAQLKANNFPLSALQDVCTCPDLKAAGINATQLKAAGYTAERLQRCGFDACELRGSGFTALQLKDAGLTDGELKGAGFTDAEVGRVSGLPQGVSVADVRKAGCSVGGIKKLRELGVSAAAIRRINGCSASQMKAAEFGADALKEAGFTAAELKRAGFAGGAANGSCSVSSIRAAREAGKSAAEIRDTFGCDVAAMKAAGFSAAELKAAGYTAAELRNAGFTAQQLKNAGFSAEELRAAGFSAQQLKDAGFTAAQLREAGFSAADLKAAGFSAAQLKAAGFSASELKSAGFSASELRAAGFTAKELKAAGFSAQQLQAAGYTPDDLQRAGVNVKQSALAELTGPAPAPGETSATLPSISKNPQQVLAEANAKHLNEILQKQRQQMTAQQHQQMILQRSGMMAGAAGQLLQSWKSSATQTYVGGNPPSDKKNAAEQGEGSHIASGISNKQALHPSESNRATPPAISAGDVLFAVLDTSVDSDEPGPVLATIVSGDFKGTKLIGSFNFPPNADKMVISFNRMSVPGAVGTTAINAYAIDPNTARTALSSQTNHHYLSRYGALFASTFIEGFGNAFQSSGTTITIGGSGGAVQNTTISNGVGRSVLENAVIGLATVGKNWGQVAMQNVNQPTTVLVYSGTGLGILFTQDVPKIQ